MPNDENTSTTSGITWTASQFEKLVELVKPHPFIYNVKDPSRKNILARETTWELIARELSKPVEDCKKRWRALRDGYMKTVRHGNWSKPKVGLFKKLEFLNDIDLKTGTENQDLETEVQLEVTNDDLDQEVTNEVFDQHVITDNQEYYEITLVEAPQDNTQVTLVPKIILPQMKSGEPPVKIGRKNCGRKKYVPSPVNIQPIKILPKPVNVLNGANLVHLVEDTSKVIQQPQTSQPVRSDILDSLIEKVLSEHTNSIDVFFRSMAASVKKLPPTLIPKVKMEVCNVIAKYEMQSFDKNLSNSS